MFRGQCLGVQRWSGCGKETCCVLGQHAPSLLIEVRE